MNKTLMLILIPCLVAFVMAQYYPGAGVGGYGYTGAYGNPYYNFAVESAKGAKLAKILNYGLLFFIFIVLTNATRNIIG